MSINFSIFQSKVARRMILLFVSTSLLPVALLAILTFTRFTDSFVKQNQAELHLTTKNVGMGVLDKLSHIQIELQRIAFEINRNHDHSSSKTIIPSDYFSQYFTSLTIESINDQQNSQTTSVLDNGWLTTEDVQHLLSGKAIIRTTNFNNQPKRIYLITALGKQLDDGLLMGAISIVELWKLENLLPSATDACIFNSLFDLLYCSDPITNTSALSYSLSGANQSSSYFEWMQRDEVYSAYQWPIFLEGAYRSPEWIVVLNKPRKDIYAPIAYFKSVYPAVILASLMLIALVSSVQIRKYLVPLALLKDATRAIAGGNFNTQIELNSHDEFEELANAYNDMTHKLDRQFKSLATMSEVDRSILTSLDPDYIIETVLKGIQDLMPQSDVNLLSIDKHNNPIISKYAIKTTRFSQHKVKINEDEEKILKAHSNYLLIKPGSTIPNLLANFIHHGDFTIVLFPILLKQDLIALVTVRHPLTIDYQDSSYTQIRELIDRIAVAMTNASWEVKLYQQSNFDSLTQLPNRTLLQDRLDQAIKRARRDSTQVAVLFVDIDRFKSINDSMGYKAGDELIRQVAERLTSIADSVDSFGRYGSDEFMFIVSDISYKANYITKISAFAEFILKEIRKSFVINHHEIMISASMGIAISPTDAITIEDLVNYSEIAMHHAKSQGKGTFHFYAKEINAQSFAQLVLENDLRRALEKDELELFFQPQFGTNTFQVVGAEALIRWHHPRLGLLHPGQFLAMANESGLILQLGEWVIRRTCSQLRLWQLSNLNPVRISINLSSHQFRDEGLVHFIKGVIDENQISAKFIELEMTEDTIMSDIDKATQILHELKALGFHLSVDDFGTGYSTLNYLAKFPVDCLKIDQSFVHDMIQDNNMKSIVSAIVALGHSLNLTVIAEGIETEKQLELLQQLNCDIVQGFLMSEPMSTLDFSNFLTKHQADLLRFAN